MENFNKMKNNIYNFGDNSCNAIKEFIAKLIIEYFAKQNILVSADYLALDKDFKKYNILYAMKT
jgi:hypothetical protein